MSIVVQLARPWSSNQFATDAQSLVYCVDVDGRCYLEIHLFPPYPEEMM